MTASAARPKSPRPVRFPLAGPARHLRLMLFRPRKKPPSLLPQAPALGLLLLDQAQERRGSHPRPQQRQRPFARRLSARLLRADLSHKDPECPRKPWRKKQLDEKLPRRKLASGNCHPSRVGFRENSGATTPATGRAGQAVIARSDTIVKEMVRYHFP